MERERLWNKPITDNDVDKAYRKMFDDSLWAQCETCANQMSAMHFYAVRHRPDLLLLVCKTCGTSHKKGACQRFLMGLTRARTWIFRKGTSHVAQCDICEDPETFHIFLDRLKFHAAHDKADSRGGTTGLENMYIGHVGCNRHQHTLQMKEIREKHLEQDAIPTPQPFCSTNLAERLTMLLRASPFNERAFVDTVTK